MAAASPGGQGPCTAVRLRVGVSGKTAWASTQSGCRATTGNGPQTETFPGSGHKGTFPRDRVCQDQDQGHRPPYWEADPPAGALVGSQWATSGSAEPGSTVPGTDRLQSDVEKAPPGPSPQPPASVLGKRGRAHQSRGLEYTSAAAQALRPPTRERTWQEGVGVEEPATGQAVLYTRPRTWRPRPGVGISAAPGGGLPASSQWEGSWQQPSSG